VWFTKGGMYSVVQAFENLFLEIGGQIHTNSEVSEIVVRNRKAIGVIANGDFHQADLVVSNTHFAHTHLDLIKPEHRRKFTERKVRKMDYSMSCFLMYIGVKKQYPQLKHHTLILSERYKELVKDIFDRKTLPDDFSMYLHVPTRTDASMAPAGSESMYVLIPVPNLSGNTNWSEMAQPYAQKILTFLEENFGLEGLRENIEVLELFTPEDFQTQRNNYLGSAWGLEPKLTQSASFRPSNRSKEINGLYMVGASTHPGAGVPGVLLTAEATEKAIMDNHKESQIMIPKTELERV
jgi:phytoene desaturase